jgi:hypothetical protein
VELSVALDHYVLLPPSAILDWFGSMEVFFSTPRMLPTKKQKNHHQR